MGTILGDCNNIGVITGEEGVGGNIGLNEEGTITEERLQNTGTVNEAEPTEENKIGRNEN